ncbi:MAG: hypothetical protein ACKO3Q_13830 [Betaproteobacteria bacterium]
MDSTRLVTFYELLQQGYTVAQLATAVEHHGVAGWDRFGRYTDQPVKPSSDMAGEALDVLATYSRYERAFESDVEAYQLETQETGGSRAIEHFEEWSQVPIHHLGWPEGRLPEFGRIEPSPVPPRRGAGSSTFRDETLLHTIGALLDFIETRHNPPSQARIIDDILGRHPALSGGKPTTLEKCFARANEALGRTPKHSKRK